ncbi:MAG TPA: hypothetical protein VGB72_02220 [Acidobacteriota bacterium]
MAGHIASDVLGLDLLLDEVERKGAWRRFLSQGSNGSEEKNSRPRAW